MKKLNYNIDKPIKLSEFLYSLGLKPSEVKRVLKNKDVKVNGVRRSKDEDLIIGQEVCVYLNLTKTQDTESNFLSKGNMNKYDKSESSLQDNKINLRFKHNAQKLFEIFYEDENVVIVNKFAGIEVVGKNSLEDDLKYFAVHRLDRNTEGLVILAKTCEAREELLRAFKERLIIKKYLCEVVGKTNFNGEVYSAYLFKDSKKSKVYIYETKKPNTVLIKTKFKTLKSSNQTSVVECELLTGKTHQIRAQLAYLGHAILGDGKYGKNEDNKKFKESTQKLHCYYLGFKNLSGKLNYLNELEFVLYPKWINNFENSLK